MNHILLKIGNAPFQEFSDALDNLLMSIIKWSLLFLVIIILYIVVKNVIKGK